MAKDLDSEVVFGDLTRSDLYAADEVFLVGTAAEVSAVSSVDDREIACPGPVTTAIRQEYAKVARGQVATLKAWVELCQLPRRSPPRSRAPPRPRGTGRGTRGSPSWS